MGRRYTYIRYNNDNRESDSFFGNSEYDDEGFRGPTFEPFAGWFAGRRSGGSVLPWIGGAFIALGLLIVLFPMLLVIAVAALFFMMGAVCLSIWWQFRDHSRRIRIHTNTLSWWERARYWLRERLS
jgi:hypothetical protein